jgi:hypothetical protein
MVMARATNPGVRAYQQQSQTGGYSNPPSTYGVDYNDDPSLGSVGYPYRPQRGPGNVQSSTYVTSLVRRNQQQGPGSLPLDFRRQRGDFLPQPPNASLLSSLIQSQYGPQMAGIGAADATLRAQQGFAEADYESMLNYLNQQSGMNEQGLGITLGDIGRRRGFAGRERDIAFGDINSRRGFAGRDRDLVRQLIDTERGRLQDNFGMDNINLNSEYTPRGAFTSNMANARRGHLESQLGFDLADQDTRFSQNDLAYDQAMRGLLTQEQRAALGYDMDMSGLLTQEQRARLESQSGSASTQRQIDQAALTRAQAVMQADLDMARNDVERGQVVQSMIGWLSTQGLTGEQIESIIGPYLPKSPVSSGRRGGGGSTVR